MSNTRYRVTDFMIVDAKCDPESEIHIRELLDSECYEFQYSKLSTRQKLDIIDALQIETLTSVLHECYQNAGKTYNAVHEAQFSWLKMRNELALINSTEFEIKLRSIYGGSPNEAVS